jgi:hypothetical protein
LISKGQGGLKAGEMPTTPLLERLIGFGYTIAYFDPCGTARLIYFLP